MRRRDFIASAAIGLACLPRRSAAQERPITGVRIGWLTAQRKASLTPYLEAFRAGLAELGYEEGRSLIIEYRYADDAIERVPDLAMELLHLPVALIVVQGVATSVVQRLNLPVPVVYVTSSDPVLAGFTDSFARPRGNMTGMTFMFAEMNVKRLELLRELIPELRRVAVLGSPDHPGEQLERAHLDETARRLELVLTHLPTRSQDELTGAFATMAAAPPEAICVLTDGFTVQNRERIIAFAMDQRVPVVSGWPVMAQSGALCTYGPSLPASYRRLASYVERILKGAKPAELPIERPTTFQLIVNLKTARALGLTIPPTLLARADEVIE